jgi:RNA polymerase sigma factor (sigma-70 family)
MDEDSFISFYNSTFRNLWGYVYRVTWNRSLADEVAQESFVRLLERGRGEFVPTKMRAYLFAIASNLIRDHWKESKRYEESPYEEQNDKPAREAQQSDLKMDFQEAFEKLQERERALLWLAYVERYDHSEIATMLTIKKDSVRVLLYRARQKLHGILVQRGFAEELKT